MTAEHEKVELDGFLESGFDGNGGNEACMHFTRGLKVEGSVKTEDGALGTGLGLEKGHGVFAKKEEEEDFMAKFAASITELCLLEILCKQRKKLERREKDEKGFCG